MLNQLRQAIADQFLVGGDYSPENIAAAQVALWKFLSSPYFAGNYDQLEFKQMGPLALSLEMQDNGPPLILDPLLYFYTDGWEEENNQAFRIPFPPRSFSEPVFLKCLEQLPEDVLFKAQKIVEDVVLKHPRFVKILRPTQLDFSSRQRIELEILSFDDLNARLDEILGENHHRRLLAEGIRYHNPNYLNKGSRFVVAHNNEEVAGVVGIGTGEVFNCLSYVSVAPGFRQQGLSRRMYQKVIELCQAEGKALKRSSPSSFTLDRPAITRSYDRMLQESPVLHVTSGSYLERALEIGLETIGMERFFSLAKPICDARLNLEMKRYEVYLWESQQAQQLNGVVSGLKSLRKKGPRP